MLHACFAVRDASRSILQNQLYIFKLFVVRNSEIVMLGTDLKSGPMGHHVNLMNMPMTTADAKIVMWRREPINESHNYQFLVKN